MCPKILFFSVSDSDSESGDSDLALASQVVDSTTTLITIIVHFFITITYSTKSNAVFSQM